MLYLKYRPQKVEEIDNLNVKQKISDILSSSDIPHAFLLTGEKGTGKTSTARIIAKAVNCLDNSFSKKNKSIEPCGVCAHCTSITIGNNPDVIELDAASNRKIDEVRELISKIKYAPLSCLYKVYIIDEVHMLTTEAFNALLKTLEEPPKNTIFILATTETQKLPKTIISRCIKVNFGKANKPDILHMLNRIIVAEKISISDEVCEYISIHSDNSFRDAAKILDEILLAQTTGKIDLLTVKKILGVVEQKENLLRILDNKNNSEMIKTAFEFVEDYENRAGDFKTLLESMLDELHDLLLQKSGIEIEKKYDYNFSLKDISRLAKILNETYNGLKYSANESLLLEVAIVEFIEGKV